MSQNYDKLYGYIWCVENWKMKLIIIDHYTRLVLPFIPGRSTNLIFRKSSFLKSVGPDESIGIYLVILRFDFGKKETTLKEKFQ